MQHFGGLQMGSFLIIGVTFSLSEEIIPLEFQLWWQRKVSLLYDVSTLLLIVEIRQLYYVGKEKLK